MSSFGVKSSVPKCGMGVSPMGAACARGTPEHRRDADATVAVLLIGYGNLLRSDDGVGPAIVSRLAAIFYDNPRGAFLAPHQLTPELAEDLAGAQRVVFVDATVELPAGEVGIRRLDGASVQAAAVAPLGHHATPEALLALCYGLYGRAPCAWSIGVGVANLEVGDRLSPLVARAANRLCRRLAYRIRGWCRSSKTSFVNRKGSHVCQ